MKHLKLFFACLLTTFLSIGQVLATEVTFTAGTDTSDELSLTKDGVTITLSSGTLSRTDNYRCYANATMTISSTSTITAIEFNCNANGTSKGGPGTINTTTGTYSASTGKTGSWSGSSTSIEFSASAQCQINSFTVTLSGGTPSGDTPSPTLSSIAVATAPTKTTYTEGENFDPTGLVITRNYSNSTSDTYTYANHSSDFSFNPSTSTELVTSNTSVTITYGGKSTTQAITVNAASSGEEQTCDSETAGNGAITFGSADGSIKINDTNVNCQDNRGKTWDITTVTTSKSFTQNAEYSQVGASSKPATSITFTTTLCEEMSITAFSAKFGGFSGTAGTVTLKVDNTTVGSGSLNGTSDVTVSKSQTAVGSTLTITVTSISKGVKCYNLSYSCASAAGVVKSVTISPEGGNFVSSQTVTLSQEDSKSIYYTTNGTDPKTNGTLYSNPFSITETSTVKAAAKDGDNWSDITEQLFTKIVPLSTMQAIFDAATSTATDQIITFSSNWVVTGISTNGKNAYLTDGTKGLILFNTNASAESPVAGLAVGNTLSGTVTRSLTLYNGAAELTDFTAEGLEKGTGTIPDVNELDATAIGNLSGVNTGSLIKISGACTVNSNRYYIAGVQLFNSLYAFTNPTAGSKYDCTGVYVQYNSTKEILPRSESDLTEQTAKSAAETYWNGAISGSLSIRANETVENLWSTASTGTKHFSSSNEAVATISDAGAITIVGTGSTTLTYTTDANDSYYEGTATLTLTVKASLPAGGTEFTWDATAQGYTNEQVLGEVCNTPVNITFAKANASNDPKYFTSDKTARVYTNGTLTITAPNNKLLYEIVFDANISVSADKGIYESGVWSGLAKEVVFTPSATSKIKTINIIYADGTITELEIASINLKTTDGETALTITKNVDATIIYEGIDENVATIANNKVTPVGIGSTTVTARIAQGTNYTAAETTFTIAVAAKTIPEMSFPEASYNASLGVKFTEPVLTKPEGVTVHYSSDNAAVSVNEITGEITLNTEGSAVITATSVENDEYAVATASYTLNVIDPNKDVLTAAAIGKTSYGDWSKSFTSAVVYAGNSTTNADRIQMRAQDNSGIVSTSNIGYLKSISATAASGNTDDHYLLIYAKSTAYESAADLYDASKRGDLIGKIAEDGGNIVFENGKAYSDHYKYIGIKSNYGAVYYDNITIVWEPAEFTTYSVTYKAGEGIGDDVVSNVDEGTTIQVAANTFTAPEGKEFAGWKLNGEGDILAVGSNYTVTSNVNFVAQWQEEEAPATEDDLTGTWVLVTDATQLVAGKKVIIASVPDEGAAVTMSTTQATNNRIGLAGAIVSEGVITAPNGTAVFTIEAGTEENTIAFKSSADEYLYAASSDKNYIRSQETNDANGSWIVTISEGVATIVAQGDNTHNIIRYNPNNNSPIFACYGSSSTTGTLITLYMLEEEIPEEPELNWTEERNGLTSGFYYTMCLEKAVTHVRGASIWRVLSKAQNGKDIILEEVTGTLVAGRPYFFYATADKMEVVYTGAAVNGPVNDDDNNGLVGAFTQTLITESETNFILFNNVLYYVNSEAYVGANRAYLDMTKVPAYNAGNSAPGRRRVTMQTNGEQVATGMDEVNVSEMAVKMIIDGQLFILRGEKMFDAMGRLVK